MWQIPIPEDYLVIFKIKLCLYFQNKTFGDLFNYLAAERELIPLGLYRYMSQFVSLIFFRLPGSTDNKYPYVYTNPPATVLIKFGLFLTLIDKANPSR